jgi:hypothetical protein
MPTIKNDIDNYALYHPTKYFNYANAEIDSCLDKVIKLNRTWVSFHCSPLTPSRFPYIQTWITKAKALGLKIHLRAHHTENVGNESVFQTGAIQANNAINVSTATGGSVSTLIDTTKNWTVNQWAGFQCYTTAGSGSGQYLYILSNTSNTLTFGIADFVGGSTPLSTVAFDNTTKYKISYSRMNDKSLTDTSFGYYKYVKDMASYFKNSGCESFSVMNEWKNTILYNVPGSIFLDDTTNYVSSQKDCVTYVKAQVPTGYPDGYTVSDLFYKVSDWITSNSILPLDYLGYTSYDTEPNAFNTMKQACDKFGANKIQLDEMSLSGTWDETLNTHLTGTSSTDYNLLLQRRVKYALSLGIRRVFRFEFADAGVDNGSKWGFGYYRNASQFNFGTALSEAMVKCVIDPTTIKKAVNLTKTTNHIIYPGSTPAFNTLSSGQMTFQAWIKRATGPSTGDYSFHTIISKDNSFVLRFEGDTLKLEYWKGGIKNSMTANTQSTPLPYFRDKWQLVQFSINNAGATLYLNGVSVATQAITGSLDTSLISCEIGNDFVGMIDQIIIDNVANSNISAVNKDFVNNANTILHIKMENPLTDISSYSQTGTNTNYKANSYGLVPSLRDTISYLNPKYAIKIGAKYYHIKDNLKTFKIKEKCNEYLP